MGSLQLNEVTKSFGSHQVIKPTTLTIEDGELVVFVGPSGCGKSTMLRLIAGLEDITSGTLEIDGKVVNDLVPVKRGVSMVFQSYALYPHMTVFENIAFPLRVERLAESDLRAKVENAAEILQLTDRLQHKPAQLSGGQRQRTAIGRAIVRQPSVFLFDEPLSNLDAALRMDMRLEIGRLHQRLGASMIYVTHDQVEAMTLADKIVVLKDGQVMQAGAPMDLYQNPANKFVAGFLGAPSMNFLDVRVEAVNGQQARLSSPALAEFVASTACHPGVRAGDEAQLGLRPREVEIVRQDGELSGSVAISERLGNETVIEVDIGGCRFIAVESRDMIYRIGERVQISIDPGKAYLFPK